MRAILLSLFALTSAQAVEAGEDYQNCLRALLLAHTLVDQLEEAFDEVTITPPEELRLKFQDVGEDFFASYEGLLAYSAEFCEYVRIEEAK